jgi:hypothetical protein
VTSSTAGSIRAPPTLETILPAGNSFYTFQALSYTIDIYRGEMRARRNPIDFALFVAFFPHLVASQSCARRTCSGRSKRRASSRWTPHAPARLLIA